MFKRIFVFLFVFIFLAYSAVYAENTNNIKTKGHLLVINTPHVIVAVPPNQLFFSQPMSYKKLYGIEKARGGRHKQSVLKNIKIAEHYFNHKIRKVYPLIPVGSFHGQLKKTGIIKIVFGISGNNLGNFIETAGNIYYMERYLKSRGENYKIKLVLYGGMARILAKRKSYKRHIIHGIKPVHNLAPVINPMRILSHLHKWGVRIYVCYNALMYAHLVHYLIPDFVKTVPMGILKIYELRKEGYLYFTNP